MFFYPTMYEKNRKTSGRNLENNDNIVIMNESNKLPIIMKCEYEYVSQQQFFCGSLGPTLPVDSK